MKVKLWLLIAIFVGNSYTAFAQNNQTVIPSSSEIYEYLRVILAEQGKVSGIQERPASKDMILNVFEKIDYDKLSDSARLLYSEVMESLTPTPIYTEKEKLAVDLSLDINLETYFQTDPHNVDWIKPELDHMDFITIPIEAWFFNSIYGRWNLSLAKDPFLYGKVPDHDGYWSNVPVNTSQIDFQFPYVGYFAAGSNHWNLQIGRDTLNYGSGRSGNFLISGNLPYYSFFRAKTYWDAFTFSYSAIDLEPWSEDPDTPGTFIQTKKMLVSHGFTFNFIPRIRIGINESLLQTGFDELSLNYLNPLMIFHNYYMDGFNSFLTVDVEVNVWKGINVYGVFALDQVQTAYEIDRYDATAIPNAYGYLIGTEISVPYSDGYWLGTLEWVYTNPWLYLEDSTASFIWTGQIVSNVDGRYFKELPLGYPSGPDSLNLYASIGYTKPKHYSVEGGYTLRVQGAHNVVDTVWSDDEGAAEMKTPTGIVETTHSLLIEAIWYPSFYSHIKEIGTSIGYIFVENENNILDEDHQDFQCSFHLSFSY